MKIGAGAFRTLVHVHSGSDARDPPPSQMVHCGRMQPETRVGGTEDTNTDPSTPRNSPAVRTDQDSVSNPAVATRDPKEAQEGENERGIGIGVLSSEE